MASYVRVTNQPNDSWILQGGTAYCSERLIRFTPGSARCTMYFDFCVSPCEQLCPNKQSRINYFKLMFRPKWTCAVNILKQASEMQPTMSKQTSNLQAWKSKRNRHPPKPCKNAEKIEKINYKFTNLSNEKNRTLLLAHAKRMRGPAYLKINDFNRNLIYWMEIKYPGV
jgi:hypothetical protein